MEPVVPSIGTPVFLVPDVQPPVSPAGFVAVCRVSGRASWWCVGSAGGFVVVRRVSRRALPRRRSAGREGVERVVQQGDQIEGAVGGEPVVEGDVQAVEGGRGAHRLGQRGLVVAGPPGERGGQ